MKPFQFADILTQHRKALKRTQEDIANFVGVSRAAVSKWEQGLSYPDIIVLPKLAMYFDLSIDQLLGYEPQLTKERIQIIYRQLAVRFANEPFEQVEQEVLDLTKEYYSCYPFLTKMSQLLLNYFMRSPQPNITAINIEQLCARVKQYSEDPFLRNEASVLQATTYLMLQQPDKVIDELGTEPTIDYNYEFLIASALLMQQKTDEASVVTQVTIYQSMLKTMTMMTELMAIHADDEQFTHQSVQRIEALIDLFSLKKLNVNSTLVFYVKAAYVYMQQTNEQQAMDMIEKYLKTCMTIEFPLQLMQNDMYFTHVEQWIQSKEYFMQQAPRDEASIKHDLLATVTEHPIFQPLFTNSTLKILVENVKHYLREV